MKTYIKNRRHKTSALYFLLTGRTGCGAHGQIVIIISAYVSLRASVFLTDLRTGSRRKSGEIDEGHAEAVGVLIIGAL